MDMSQNRRRQVLQAYFFISYLVIVVLSWGFVEGLEVSRLSVAFFVGATLLSSSLFYLMPALLVSILCHMLLSWRHLGLERRLGKWAALVDYGTAITAVCLVEGVLFTDRKIFTLFGFHINGFVVNLITTPGGIESMGAGHLASISYGVAVFGILVFQVFLVAFFAKQAAFKKRPALVASRRLSRVGLLVILLLTVTEKVTYAMSHLAKNQDILVAAHVFPLYQPLTIRHLAEKLGFEVREHDHLKVAAKSGRLNYPLHSLQVVPPEKPLNIVWLVAESWRADMLDPEIMPATWKFAGGAQRFTNHYSGGNGTRMGMFSMFYGLYGTYWFPFLHEERSPVIMDVLQKQGYQFGLYTSAKFSYPEFDRTLFSSIPEENLHSHQENVGWKADRINVGKMLDFIGSREPNRPFMSFMFFESPHARYYFPEESVIRRPYLEQLNYATMDVERDMSLVRNRYINACHHLDSQLGRIFAYLEEKKLLDSTVVIVTGDHGEEFMEKGRWGHNSAFHQEQIRVPLVVHVPGAGSGVTARMTSHLDIAATLLPLLGVANNSTDYSLGRNLFGTGKRTYAIISDWSRVCYVDEHFKAVIPVKTQGMLGSSTSDTNDRPLADPKSFYSSRGNPLSKIMHDFGTFTKGRNS